MLNISVIGFYDNNGSFVQSCNPSMYSSNSVQSYVIRASEPDRDGYTEMAINKEQAQFLFDLQDSVHYSQSRI